MESKLKVWIDLDNSPHVLFFAPIIEELKQRGHSVSVTARDYAQTLELLRQLNIDHIPIGRHYGKKTLHKLWGLGVRTAELAMFASRRRFSVAISHGSRSLMLVAGILRIPAISLFDYEHSKGSFLYRFPQLYLIPEAIKDMHLPKNINPVKVKRYAGTKENVYLTKFRPVTGIYNEMGLDAGNVIALIRPPATDAHYHNEESEDILFAILKKVSSMDDVTAVVVPRTNAQREFIHRLRQDHFGKSSSNLMILDKVFDGPNLVWNADLVISGGGTMSREAAALGVPAYSIFRGKTCAVDAYLVEKGTLSLIQGIGDVEKIEFKKRRKSGVKVDDRTLTSFIVDQIIAMGRGTPANAA